MRQLVMLLWAACLLLAPVRTQAAEIPADGAYTIEAALTGGSSRASVASPADLRVENGVATATIVWSSPHYDFMSVEGELYLPLPKDGNSTFEIPIILDTDIPFSAQTTAMSQPHVIEYTLRFDSATLQQAGFGAKAADILLHPLPLLAFALAGSALFALRRGKRRKRGHT